MNCFEKDITWKEILIFFDSQLKEYYEKEKKESAKSLTREEGDKN